MDREIELYQTFQAITCTELPTVRTHTKRKITLTIKVVLMKTLKTHTNATYAAKTGETACFTSGLEMDSAC